jgi:hypothetical protein
VLIDCSLQQYEPVYLDEDLDVTVQCIGIVYSRVRKVSARLTPGGATIKFIYIAAKKKSRIGTNFSDQNTCNKVCFTTLHGFLWHPTQPAFAQTSGLSNYL